MDSVNYTPPTRRSMSDDELAIVLSQPHSDEASMLAAMQLLEQQAALRAEDIRLEAMWAVEMQVLNTSQSLAALNAFRSGTPIAVQQPTAGQQPMVAPATIPDSASLDAPALSLFDQIAQANNITLSAQSAAPERKRSRSQSSRSQSSRPQRPSQRHLRQRRTYLPLNRDTSRSSIH